MIYEVYLVMDDGNIDYLGKFNSRKDAEKAGEQVFSENEHVVEIKVIEA